MRIEEPHDSYFSEPLLSTTRYTATTRDPELDYGNFQKQPWTISETLAGGSQDRCPRHLGDFLTMPGRGLNLESLVFAKATLPSCNFSSELELCHSNNAPRRSRVSRSLVAIASDLVCRHGTAQERTDYHHLGNPTSETVEPSLQRLAVRPFGRPHVL